ncbi:MULTISPECIES: DUF2326 domain-containing protein [unclassified Halomonas]|uniref:DUF2326 domain-containing protein n=1 Tax=unclassified Halomonas TaxID=2609666 RepID=UPI00048150CE|nr:MULTISPECIES: DUF2326 domain-containing protein [unclassified Halomonas]NAO94907.1 DUF2326 domain-containing protein [Halomonas sp. MG34]PKH63110.1 DUF2326 domain-containing protein [Halomonas sp. Choline-3u-9]QGQ71875.1 DUF2326 domain-containing protein [Halomonas sp. PA16-9]
MLSKITCPLFNHGEISFHSGLNIVLGDDDAKNSIGKSSALMVVDFVMGGMSLLEDKVGTIKSLGHHAYSIEFVFEGKSFFFKRSTDSSDVIQVCNQSYETLEEISVDAYRAQLKTLYNLDHLNSSFRSLVNPFSRIWNKGGLDPDQPFSGNFREPAGIAIERLIDFFERTDDILEEKAVLNSHNERKKLISKSMSAEIIPKINKTQYKSNQKLIADNTAAIEVLKQGFTGALSAYEALFDEGLRALHQQKNDLITRRNELLTKIDRLKRDLLGVTPRLTANISLIKEFFPDVKAERLEQVEAFHQNISKMVQKELKKELTLYSKHETKLIAEISELESNMHASLDAKGTPDDLFARVFDLKEVTDKAAEENKFYDQKAAVAKELLLAKERLEAIYAGIFLDIEAKLNFKLKQFNKVVYGPNRNASQIRIKSSSSYSFISSEDTGTGKSYAGLVGFDLAMLSLTHLPFIIHDSVIYKNIEVTATGNIIRILAAVKRKQIFLAFDEAAKFGDAAERRLRAHTVIKLSHDDLLYNKDWREQ